MPTIVVNVEPNENCEYPFQYFFNGLGESRPVRQVRLYHEGAEDGALYDEVKLQLSAYYKALVESTNGFAKSDNGYELMAVGLSENGNYQAKTFLPDVEPFLSALSLWVWKNKELCKKMGYGGEPK